MSNSGSNMRLMKRDAQFIQVAQLMLAQKNRREIAAALDVTESCVQKWCRTPEFQKVWQGLIDDMSGGPLREAAVTYLKDLLPEAVKEHERILRDPDISGTLKRWAIEQVYDMNALQGARVDSTRELQDFLRQAQLHVTQVNVDNIVIVEGGVSPEFASALRGVLPPDEDIVDADYTVDDEGPD